MLKKGEDDMNIYDFYRMHSDAIEHAKRKRHERRRIRKMVMERKGRKDKGKIMDRHINFYYFEKGSKRK